MPGESGQCVAHFSQVKVSTAVDTWPTLLAMGRRRATECIRGHRYDEANTYLDGKGKQRCRECMRAQEQARPKRDRSSRGRGGFGAAPKPKAQVAQGV